MLTIQNTPQFAGIEIIGDFQDLDNLYESLHTIVGDEEDYPQYDGARLRVLGVCYDIRHAFQGDREVEFVPNGMDPFRMRMMQVIAPEKNLYYKCHVCYPEALFVIMALNDFIYLYAKRKVKTAPLPLLDKQVQWDSTVASVRVFQAQVLKCLQSVVTVASFKRMMNLMYKNFPWTDRYVTQYLDLLNIRYLNLMDKEARANTLSKVVKWMTEQGKEYRQLEADIKAMATEHRCSMDDIRLVEKYPEVEW